MPFIKIGNFTKPISKADHNRQIAIDVAKDAAVAEGLVVLVKRDPRGRWQAWAQTSTARGSAHQEDYEFLAEGRRARRLLVSKLGGRVFLADTDAACGEADCVRIILPTIEPVYTTDEDAARQFASILNAMQAAERRGVRRFRIVRHKSMWNHPAREGGFMILSTELSGPLCPVYVSR